jgi:acyl-ACP thioesterase
VCATRRVRLADSRPSGRLRLDGIARYLQDIAADDMRDAGLAGEVAWVVRRTVLVVRSWPRFDDEVDVATWCSGAGAAWAERRTRVTVDGGAAVEAAALWVSLDPATMRPTPLTDEFLARYGAGSGGRPVRTRLTLPRAGAADVAGGRPWPLRSSDVDMLGHVNNAVAWAAVEDEMTAAGPARVTGAVVEHRAPIAADAVPVLARRADGDGMLVWLTAPDATTFVTARVATVGPDGRPGPPPGA